MVVDYKRRFESQVNVIRTVLQKASVPKQWYSVGEPFECRISIIAADDGIHVFVPERGERNGEKIYTEWYDAIEDIADFFELSCTDRVMRMAKLEKEKESALEDEKNIFSEVKAVKTYGSAGAHWVAAARNPALTHKDNAAKVDFNIGDMVRVYIKVVRGNERRIQAFEGSVTAKRDKTFTVRRVSYGIGVERSFPYNSPRIDHVEIIRRGKVRRAKLYYLRSRQGKAAKIKEIKRV